jgi:hypothetical protein
MAAGVPMGTTREIFRYKKVRGDRIIEAVIWHLAEPMLGSLHSYKFRLFYGTTDGICLVRYDNERGKGDHRHVNDTEEPYVFTTLRKLIEDFEADIERR